MAMTMPSSCLTTEMRVLMLGTVLLKIADWSFGGSVTSPWWGWAPVHLDLAAEVILVEGVNHHDLPWSFLSFLKQSVQCSMVRRHILPTIDGENQHDQNTIFNHVYQPVPLLTQFDLVTTPQVAVQFRARYVGLLQAFF